MAPAKIKIARCSKTKTVVTYNLKNRALGDVTSDDSRWDRFQNEICKEVGIDTQAHQLLLHRPGSCGSDLDRRAFNQELSDGTEFFQYHITARQPSGQERLSTQSQARNIVSCQDQAEEQEGNEADHEVQQEEHELMELDASRENDQGAEDDVQRSPIATEQLSDGEEFDEEHDGDEEVYNTGDIDRRAADRTKNGETDPEDPADDDSNRNADNESSEERSDGHSESHIRQIRDIGSTRIQTPNFRGKLKTDTERQPQPHAVIRVGTRDDLRLDAVDGEDGVPMEVILVAVVWCRTGANPNITLREAESWLVNGVCIGDWENGQDVRNIGAVIGSQGYTPDGRFRGLNTQADLFAELHSMVANGYDEIDVDDFDKLPASMPQQQKDRLAIAPPIILFTTQKECGGAIDENSDEEDVHAVIRFRNLLTSTKDLKLEVNLQATLDFNETAESFRTFLMEGHSIRGRRQYNFNGLKTGFNKGYSNTKKKLGFWCEFELYIFAQTGELVLHRWDNDKNRDNTANFFLDRDVSREYGKRLYLEVHVIEDPDHEEKEKARLAEVRAEEDQKETEKQKKVQDKPAEAKGKYMSSTSSAAKR